MIAAVTWFVGLVNPSVMSFYIIASMWVIFGSYILLRMIQDGHYWLSILPAILTVLIVVAIVLPVETFDSLMAPLNAQIKRQGSPLLAGKIGHIICFAFFVIFLQSIRKSLRLHHVDLYAVTILLAAATEGMQLFVPGRTPQLRDFIFDILGIGLGTILFVLYCQYSNVANRPRIASNHEA